MTYERFITLKEAAKKERMRIARAKWVKNNPEKVKAIQRKWCAKNQDKNTEYRREWRKLHPDAAYRATKAKREKYKVTDPLFRRREQLMNKFGLSWDAYQGMLASQGHKCAICYADSPGGKTDWHVDHCHATGVVRGILCIHCNRTVHSRVTPQILRRAAVYLEAAAK